MKEEIMKEFAGCGWIWYDHYGYEDVNVFMDARKSFYLDEIPAVADIKITADSRYKLYVNGEYVGYGPARGFLESYPFDRVSIKKYLKKGTNVIGVVVWQWGHGTFQSIYGGAGGLLISGTVGDIDIGTKKDNGWLVRKCPGHKQHMIRRTVQLAYQECLDARKTEEWLSPDVVIEEGKNGWLAPEKVGGWRIVGCAPWLSLEEREIPLLKEEEKIFKEVVSSFYGESDKNWEDEVNLTKLYIREKNGIEDFTKLKNPENLLKLDEEYCEVLPFPDDKKITLVIDFGEEMVGFIGIDFEGEGGEVFDFTTAEIIENNWVFVASPDWGCKVATSDRYIAKKGRNKFETFSIHGFRYLALTMRNIKKGIKIYKIYGRAIEYPFTKETHFHTPDELVNKIWDMCVRTQKRCSLDSYVDCPWREQAQWWGDARVQAVNTYYLFGDMQLFRRGIKQGGQSQLPNGLTYGHFPTMAVGCIVPDFTLTWIHTHLDYYGYTGDISLMREQYEQIKKAIKFFVDYSEKNYLLGEMPEWWVFLDWAPLYKEGFNCTFNLMFLSALRVVSQISGILEKEKEAELYGEYADEIEKRIVEIFWDNENKVFLEGYDLREKRNIFQISQHSHSLAILLDICEQYHRDWVENILIPPMKLEPLEHPKIVEGSPFFYYYIIEAIKKVGGYEEEIIEFIKRRWGRMVEEGATTCYEMWNVDKGSTSLCHAWSAHPVVHLVEIMGGIKPAGPFWSEIKKYPHPYKLGKVELKMGKEI